MLFNTKTILAGSILSLLWACSPTEKIVQYQTSESGLEYAHVEENSGDKIKDGDWILFYYSITTVGDSVIQETTENEIDPNNAYQVNSSEQVVPEIEEALKMCSTGDSISIKIDTKLLMGNRVPPDLQKEEQLKFNIRIVEVETDEAHIAKVVESLAIEHIEKNEGAKIKDGDWVTFHHSLYTPSDSLLGQTSDKPIEELRPYQVANSAQSFRELEYALKMSSLNDSIVFKMDAQKIMGRNLPLNLSPEDKLSFHLKVLKVETEEERQLAIKAQQEAQIAKDDELIQGYLSKNGLTSKAQKTESGMYYIITKEGSGEKPTSGMNIEAHYTGTLLDGTKFDSSVDRGKTFEFPLGQGRVIKGWDEGFALLNKGAKATLLIPSALAYGDRPMGQVIKANSVLKFDVELVDFKPAQ